MNFLTLDLNLLRVFDMVMVEQNLTRAADKLAMTQPAVSNAMKRLRYSLADELVIRTAYGVKPTPRAEILWPIIREALSQLEAAIAPENFDPSKAQVTFRMAMADATAAMWMPSLVTSFEKEAPHMRARLIPLITRDPRVMLAQGDIDIAVGFFPGVAAQLSGGQGAAHSPIRHERLYSGHYVCVMSKNHPLANQEMTLDRYCDANHVLVSFSGRAHGLIDDELNLIGRSRKILLTVNQFFTGGKVVANSNLLTVLPFHLIESTGMSEALVWKALPLELPDVHVDMLWHERDSRNPAHRWLREHFVAMTQEKYHSKNI